MVEKYFALQFIGKVIVIGIFAVAILSLIIMVIVQSIRWNHKIKLLKKQGFERYLHGVPAYCNLSES